MEIDQWLNFKDYSIFQLTIALIGSILWVMVYFFLIKDTIQKKYIEMPYFIVCGNFAWEILYAYFFDGYINLGQVYVWGYRAWFFMDIFIFILLIKYGKKQTDNPWVSKNFKTVTVSLLAFFLIFFYAWILQGYDNTPIHGDGSVKLGATSAYLLNFGITVLYFIHFFKQSKGFRFSKPIAWCKGIGTGLFTLLFYQVDPENYIVTTLGILILIGDTIYLILLYRYQPIQKIQNINLNAVKFFKNPTFEELWKTNPSYLKVKNVPIRYYKNDEWKYTSADGKYETTIGIIEGNILIETAKGEVGIEETKAGLDFVETIVKRMDLENHHYYYLADTTKITKASFSARSLVIDFHKKHKNLKQFILITNGFTRVLIKFMTPINPGVINNWILTDTIENAIYEIFRSRTVIAAPPVTQTEKKINTAYDMISKMSLRNFDAIEPVKVPEDDSFYEIFTALEILKNDKKDILHELNTLLNNSLEALKERELHFKHLFENSYEIIFVIDSNDILINFNKGAKYYWAELGMNLKTGYNIHNYLHNEQEIEFYKKVKARLLQGKKQELQLELKYNDGKNLWLNCKCHAVKISETKVYHVFLLNDITKQIELLHEKQALNQTVVSQNLKLNEFSHILYTDFKIQSATMVSVIENLKRSLSFKDININKVTVLRKALDDMDKVIADLHKVLNDNSSNSGKYN